MILLLLLVLKIGNNVHLRLKQQAMNHYLNKCKKHLEMQKGQSGGVNRHRTTIH